MLTRVFMWRDGVSGDVFFLFNVKQAHTSTNSTAVVDVTQIQGRS